MQALHLCYGVGALVVPLIAEPFLLNSELSQEEAGNSMILHTSHGFNGTTNITMPTTTTYPGISDEGNDPSNLRLVYPYSVVAGVLGFNCIYFFLLWKCYPKTEEHPSRKQPPVDKSIAIKNAVEEAKTSADDKDISMRDTKKNTKSNLSITFAEGSSSGYNTVCDANDLAVVPYKGLSSSTAASQGNKMSKDDKEGSIEMMPITLTSSFRDDTQESPQECELKKRRDFYFWKGFVIVLTVMFMHIYYGLEITFGSFLTTFAHESGLQLSKADGAHMTSLFWGTFTVLRLFTVFYIEYVGAEMNILLSLVVVLIANVLLVPFGNSNELCLWIGVGVIGLGTSSIWASLFGYLEEYFTVTSRIAAGMIVSAIVGEFVFPLIISNFVQDYPQVGYIFSYCDVCFKNTFLPQQHSLTGPSLGRPVLFGRPDCHLPHHDVRHEKKDERTHQGSPSFGYRSLEPLDWLPYLSVIIQMINNGISEIIKYEELSERKSDSRITVHEND